MRQLHLSSSLRWVQRSHCTHAQLAVDFAPGKNLENPCTPHLMGLGEKIEFRSLLISFAASQFAEQDSRSES